MNINSFLQCLSVGVLTLCFGSISAQSQNVYCVGPVATGNGSGADWADLMAWNSSPTRGSTWYLVGGTFSGQTFNVATSGSSYITITKATLANYANVTTTGWNSTMATQAVFVSMCTFLTGNWVFDGQTPQNTNWDLNPSDYGFKFADGLYNDIHIGPNSGTASNYVIAHMTGHGHSGDPGSTPNFCISPTSSGSEVDNVTISNCLMNVWQNDIATAAATEKNWLIEGNVFFGTTYYSDAHCENVSENYGQDQNITVCNNLFYNNTNVTGCIVVALNGSAPSSGWYIYGNVFYHDITTGNGIICTGSDNETATGVYIYNNTFDGCTSPWLGNIDSQSVLTGNATNNLFYNMSGSAGIIGNGGVFGPIDYGAYFSCSGNSGDAHIQTASGNPFVNDSAYNFQLKTNTAPGAGLPPPYNVDPLGNARVTWTRGALEYTTGTPGTNPIISVSPLTLNFGSVLTNTTSYLTNTVQNSGGGVLAGTASMASSGSSQFSIVSGGSYSLGAAQSANVIISFSPNTVGSFTNTITFTVVGGNGLTESLSGTGVASYPAPQVSPITQSGSDVDTNTSGLQVFAGYSESYSGSASDPSGLPLSWQWIYTINGSSEYALQSGTGAVATVSYTYPAGTAGSSCVWKLRVSNGYSTSESDLTVGVEAPLAVSGSLTFQPSAGNISAPFVLNNGYVSQSATTGTNGGQLSYYFQTANSSVFAVEAMVYAPNIGANSFYVNIDALPTDPTNIWDLPVTTGFTNVIVTWRGNGTNDQMSIYAQQNFSLNAGLHQLIIKGREGGAELGPVTIVQLQPPPPAPVVMP